MQVATALPWGKFVRTAPKLPPTTTRDDFRGGRVGPMPYA